METELDSLKDEARCMRRNEDNEDNEMSDSTADFQEKSARGLWGSKAEFFLAIMGYTVGIGSVWRFPIICSRNGGGAFLIPFFLFLIVVGGPLYYLEVCLGQFTGLSAGLSFDFCPLFKGLGLLQVVLSAIVMWYSMMILAWSYYFLYSSFFPILPWSSCDQYWNTDRCVGSVDHSAVNETSLTNNVTGVTSRIINGASLSYNLSGVTTGLINTTSYMQQDNDMQSASFEFWEYKVIGRSAGFEEPGYVQGHLAICLLIAWVTVVMAVIKGVKTLGKVVYVTATVPYLMLTVMFIKGLTMEGAVDGIMFYVNPDFSKLADAQVWIDAAVQVFYSLGPCWGGVITMASYNKFHQKSFWSSTMCVASSGFTSFYNGMVVFTIMGFMAKESNMEVGELAKNSGPGLVFVAFPTAISKLPVPQLWSVLFFLTLITVVFDSLFGEFETVTSCLIDMFPRRLVRRRVYVNIAVGIFFFIIGLPLTLNCGIYMLQLCDWYFSRFALLVGAAMESFIICWIYGTERFSKDIELMMGRRVSLPLRILWSIVIPGLAMVVLVVLSVQYSPPDYGDGYLYSPLSIGMGIFGGLLPIIAMVITGCWVLRGHSGTLRQRLKQSLKPGPSWKPNDRQTCKGYPYMYDV